MKRTLNWISCLLIAVSVTAVAGCRSQDQAAADNNNPGVMTPGEARSAIGDVTIGHQVGADGTIAGDQKGNNFTAGQPVIIAFKIGKAPAGTPVTVAWYGPDGQQVASDQKMVSSGDSTMTFTAKDTSGWGPGDYHVDLSAGGQKVDTERFGIVAPDQAENTATKPKDTVADVAVGHQLGANGGIAASQEGKHFAPGQAVFIVFRAGSAPPGTNIQVEWYGPDNQKLLSDQQEVKSGDSMMHFASDRTGGWGLGDYRADLLVNGQKVDTEHFSVVNAIKADKTGR
jgi:hypothetical protein